MSRRHRFDVSFSSASVRAVKRTRPDNPSHRQHTHIAVDDSGIQRGKLVVPVSENSLALAAQHSANHIQDMLMAPPEPFVFPHNDDDFSRGEDFNRQLEAEGLVQLVTSSTGITVQKQKRARTQADHPLAVWTPHIDHFTEEFLRLEAFDHTQPLCPCGTSITGELLAHRCVDCLDLRQFCMSCMVESHASTPLHRIQRWTGLFFERVSLKSLGLKIQLGHPLRKSCSNPNAAFDNDFIVLDISGVHEVCLSFCGCSQMATPATQLLRHRLFPSTTLNPQTAATFRLLELMQMLGFMSGTSTYQIYKTIFRITDNTGTKEERDRYHALLRMIREWRHIRLLKRKGRGHAASGVAGTSPGECAVPCLACPRPGINLPSDYLSRPESERFIYTLFLGLDANFRLKRMNVSSYERDPGLNHGYAYIVKESEYKQYLKKFDSLVSEEKSTCNDHDAIKSATIKASQGAETTGVGTVECIRHDMKRPTSVGDLQKGERYVNMDYLFLRSLEHNTPPSLFVSYDIGCQWSRNLSKRCQTYPPNIISESTEILLHYLVPKFHIAAHVEECRAKYSFNYTPGSGRTDGEAPERGWADSNEVAPSTREMGPGSRHDTLDDHFGDYNWRKTSGLGETYAHKVHEAVREREHHIGAFLEFTAALPASFIQSWTAAVKAWEGDRAKPNPYRVPRTFISDKEVRLRLAREEEQDLAAGKAVAVHSDITPAVLIFQGLELEEQQRRLAHDISQLAAHATDLQRTKVIERSNTLRRKIQDWWEVQQLYIPALVAVRNEARKETPPAVHDLELLLPSALVGHAVIRCNLRLSRAEWLLRYAQAEGALNELRGHILLRSRLRKSKKYISRGQRQLRRSQSVVVDIETKVKLSASKYRSIRSRLEQLSSVVGEVGWQNVLKPLEDEDVAGLTYFDDGKAKRPGLGEGYKKLSWIWLVQGSGENLDESAQAALRLEWCKARARAHRWQEECLLLNEEMRRIKASLLWEAENWDKLTIQPVMINQENRSTTSRDATTLAGKTAYAYRQASIRRDMSKTFEHRWVGLADKLLTMEDGDPDQMVEAPAKVLEAACGADDGTRLDEYLDEGREDEEEEEDEIDEDEYGL